ncbi:MAG: HipA N-terminal domain-containing protein [Peptostreptococcaceae bacterium]|nr:HipA N-terminal domain-containing protein [Peptostreptococcaceae bacterium]
MDTFRKAYVYVRNIFAGVLSETDEGYSFSYTSEYLSRDNSGTVSLTLPLTEQTYTSKTLFSFFDGIIPEGWLLDAVSRNWKIDSKDRFGILLVACKDSIGNVSIKEERI